MYFVIGQSPRFEVHQWQKRNENRRVLMECIYTGPERIHEIAEVQLIDAALVDSRTFTGVPVQYAGWTAEVSMDSKLRLADEEAQARQDALERRQYLINVTSNRCDLEVICQNDNAISSMSLICDHDSLPMKQCQVEVEMAGATLADTADFLCHMELLAHYNRVASRRRLAERDRYRSAWYQCESHALQEIYNDARGIPLTHATHLPIEMLESGQSFRTVIELQAISSRFCTAALFIPEGWQEPVRGTILKRTASVRLDGKVVSHE